jgi:hypothetical protein
VDRSSGDSGDPSRNWGAGMLIAEIIATGIRKQVETSRRFPGRGWSSLLWHEANGFGMFRAQAQRDSSSAGLGGGMFRGALDGARVAASRGSVRRADSRRRIQAVVTGGELAPRPSLGTGWPCPPARRGRLRRLYHGRLQVECANDKGPI